jgi:uncharacterized protein
MGALDQFAKKQYLNLETFRRNGQSMKTPVWFAQDGETLYVVTMANSGKVKRIRNSGKVNVAACKMDGKVIGTWVPAMARESSDPEISEKVDQMFNKKYGLMKKLFASQRASKGAKDIVLEIKITG